MASRNFPASFWNAQAYAHQQHNPTASSTAHQHHHLHHHGNDDLFFSRHHHNNGGPFPSTDPYAASMAAHHFAASMAHQRLHHHSSSTSATDPWSHYNPAAALAASGNSTHSQSGLSTFAAAHAFCLKDVVVENLAKDASSSSCKDHKKDQKRSRLYRLLIASFLIECSRYYTCDAIRLAARF